MISLLIIVSDIGQSVLNLYLLTFSLRLCEMKA